MIAGPALVQEKLRWAVDVDDYDVHIPVIIEVAKGGATSRRVGDPRKCTGNIFKGSITFV